MTPTQNAMAQRFIKLGMMDMIQRIRYSTSPFLNVYFVLGALLLGPAFFSVSSQALASENAEVVDRIVAVVNDEIIVLQEVNGLMNTIKNQVDASAYSEEEKQSILGNMRQNIIDQLVNRKLIVQAANDLDWLEISEKEIDASVQRYMQQNNLTDEQLRVSLAEEGLTMEDFRAQLKESSLASAVENYEVASKIVITKEDALQYYNDHIDKYSGGTTYHLRNIFISAPASGGLSIQAEVKEKLAQIAAGLESGEPFENLARKYSESTYASEGGELGNFKLQDLSPNLRAAIQPLSPGETTPPIKTGDGYQILYVQEIHKEPDVSFESVYKDIENEIYQQQYGEKRKEWIEGLRENAHIKIIE